MLPYLKPVCLYTLVASLVMALLLACRKWMDDTIFQIARICIIGLYVYALLELFHII